MLKINEARNPIKLIDGSGYFKWPETGEFKSSYTTEEFHTNAKNTGVLGKIGYSVRADGPSERSRRILLNKLFKGEVLTKESLREEYLSDWGNPLSAQRLKRIAYSIAWFVRQRKSYERPHYEAIEKWESAIEYLRREFYEEFRSRFQWPET